MQIMKNLLYLTILCTLFCGCEVRHYGGKQPQVRVPKSPSSGDTLQSVSHDDDEGVLSLPGELVEDADSTGESLLDGMSDEFDEDVEMVDDEALKNLERMMQGLPE